MLVKNWLLVSTLLLAPVLASAQPIPVQVNVSGDTATIDVGGVGQSLADITLTFDDASGLTAASLGVSAQLVSLTDPQLLARLPSVDTSLDGALPLLVTIEPPALGGLSFDRTVRVDLHTHALVYTVGSSYRLFKAPLGGAFRDITDEIAPGSVRARGTTGGFSQFLVLADVRETGSVVQQKFDWLRARIDAAPATERPPLLAQLDAAEDAVAIEDYAAAMASLDAIRAHAAARAGKGLQDQWRATRDADNEAGEIISGAATLKFSIAYLRDFGQ
ncbi:DUF6689 family protein [Lysobacter sp. A3-1-A15]|uniref:DUF6689 family protein n=1 Tax=Novilysobacter viscosus TaxID=3098602 RepID=UPI002ED91128